MWLVTLVEKRDEEELEKLPDRVAIPAAQSLQWEPVWPVVLLHDAGPTEACNWDQPSFWGCPCPAPSHCISGTATVDHLKLAPVIQATFIGCTASTPQSRSIAASSGWQRREFLAKMWERREILPESKEPKGRKS